MVRKVARRLVEPKPFLVPLTAKLTMLSMGKWTLLKRTMAMLDEKLVKGKVGSRTPGRGCKRMTEMMTYVPARIEEWVMPKGQEQLMVLFSGSFSLF
jgi:hypothetical protein